MTNSPIDPYQEAVYGLLEQNIRSIADSANQPYAKKMIKDVAININTYLIEIVDSPKGILLKQAIAEQLEKADPEFFPVLEALIDTENISEIVDFVKNVWLNHKDSNIRQEAAHFIGSVGKDLAFLGEHLVFEKNTNVRLQILSSLKENSHQDLKLMETVYEALKTETESSVLCMGVLYFESLVTLESLGYLVKITHDGWNPNSSDAQVVRRSALKSLEIICKKLIDEK